MGKKRIIKEAIKELEENKAAIDTIEDYNTKVVISKLNEIFLQLLKEE